MVRINLVEPRLLTDQHLLAEHTEILMLVSSSKKIKALPPNDYKLGKGHISFFVNKITYLVKRHKDIQIEMHKRGFVTNTSINKYLVDIKQSNFNDYKPTKEAEGIIKQRLLEKISMKPSWYRYKGQVKPIEFYKLLYQKSD
jgi:deoxyribonuclease (pyrimidine dimer)